MTGEPVVLLHGLAGHADEWEVVASRLIARYRVAAVDQRGHGASERHPCARTSTSTCSNSPAASSACGDSKLHLETISYELVRDCG
ncbi:alpha/beta fold hydrolase [Streptomyces sp. NPDC052196]|uniref:alpha/beta fold hydrolase n=1 Tax=Streptomyces sp. NPDC052196 TaxID=3156691 RepID=UPI00343FF21E